MSVLIVLLAVLLLAAVVIVVSAPLRAARDPSRGEDPEREDLEAARAAKYREIRDAELDFRTGKLSREDYEAVDGSLRSEAVEILDRLQASESGAGEADSPAGEDPRAASNPEAKREPLGESNEAGSKPQAEG
jgi:hypothetical protein